MLARALLRRGLGIVSRFLRLDKVSKRQQHVWMEAVSGRMACPA